MYRYFVLFGAFIVSFMLFGIVVGGPSPAGVSGIQKYTRAHSLGENYVFDPRDGWEMVNVTNLQYKYRRDRKGQKESQGQKPKSLSSPGSVGKLGDIIKAALNGLKGIGKAEPVTITWYTGKDLENPSCWPNVGWAPTDESFACALTMEGWVNRPKCFKFLELCSNPQKCAFVRVIDTCAGCARGSKHVDLTKAAFSSIADLRQGILKVHMRPATNPQEWYELLWGPRHN